MTVVMKVRSFCHLSTKFQISLNSITSFHTYSITNLESFVKQFLAVSAMWWRWHSAALDISNICMGVARKQVARDGAEFPMATGPCVVRVVITTDPNPRTHCALSRRMRIVSRWVVATMVVVRR